jgi:hypothetical protein
MHNILQGVAPPDQWVSDDEKATAAEWTVSNAKRYWLSEGGPLRPVDEGGAHLVVVGPFYINYYTYQGSHSPGR